MYIQILTVGNWLQPVCVKNVAADTNILAADVYQFPESFLPDPDNPEPDFWYPDPENPCGIEVQTIQNLTPVILSQLIQILTCGIQIKQLKT